MEHDSIFYFFMKKFAELEIFRSLTKFTESLWIGGFYSNYQNNERKFFWFGGDMRPEGFIYVINTNASYANFAMKRWWLIRKYNEGFNLRTLC